MKLHVQIRPSSEWADAYEAVTPDGRILAIGRDIRRATEMRASEEFPADAAWTVSFDKPVRTRTKHPPLSDEAEAA